MSEICDVIRLDLPARYKYLNVLCDCLKAVIDRVEQLTDRETLSYNIQLAVNEIFANIVGHAYEGTETGRVNVTVSFAMKPRHMLVELADTGVSFDPSAVKPPDLEDVQVHGYGLFLAEHLMDEVGYKASTEGNCWRLVKYF